MGVGASKSGLFVSNRKTFGDVTYSKGEAEDEENRAPEVPLRTWGT